MILRNLLKDRVPVYGIWAAAFALTAIFLCAFRVPAEALYTALILPALAAVLGECLTLTRKKKNYEILMHQLELLDQKYLLPETLPPAENGEEKILQDILRQTGKSMTEQVSYYRRETVSFREYIEMWVHEIKLPVAGLLLMCHNDHASPRYTKQLNRIDSEIEKVLYYARSESPEHDFLFQEVSLKRIIKDVILKNQEVLREKNVTIRTEGLEKTVWTDSKWLAFVLNQLISNSLKYIFPDRPPDWLFSAVDTDQQVVLTFRDNGIGIPAADLPRVFEKSFTGENGRKDSSSTGMGLYIAYRLCRKMGHTVQIHSEENVYTAVSLTFGKNDLLHPQGQIDTES